jgi:ribosomal protein L29
MKSKNWQEMKNMSQAELNVKLGDFQEKIFKLKFRHSVSPTGKSGMEIRNLRKDIARVKTLLEWHKKESKQTK